MDKHEKKQKRRQWQEEQRKKARTALPLPVQEMKAMFHALDRELTRQDCDHSRQLTIDWLKERQHDSEPVLAWLEQNGGFCDCEALANCEEAFEDAIKSES
jgi:hypothetical protein